MDLEKVRAILEWPNHGLETFYQNIIWNFSSIVAPIIDYTKGREFTLTWDAEESFKFLGKGVIEAPILKLPNFEKILKVECDAWHVGMGIVLSQVAKPMAFFSKKLNEVRKSYSTYDLEFYVIVQVLRHWRHYLV